MDKKYTGVSALVSLGVFGLALLWAPKDKGMHEAFIAAIASFVILFVLLQLNKEPIMGMINGTIKSRKQVTALAKSDFRGRYSGSYFGAFWGIAQPTMTILLFWFVFQVGFRSQPVSDAPFLLWLVAGMMPWNFFQDAWTSSNRAFVGYDYIVKKIVFNVDILPMVKILASCIMNIIYNMIILVVFMLYGWFPGVHILDMLYFSVCLTMFAWGLSMITATVTVFVKDVSQLLTIVMQFVMWLTPIMWDYHMLDAVSTKLKWVYLLNPLFYVVNGYREALIDGKWFFNHFYMMAWFWLVTIVIDIIGIRLMRTFKPHFADIL